VLPQAQASISGIVTGSRLLVYNETKAALVSNAFVSGTSFSLSYANGSTFSTGDVVRVALEYHNVLTAKNTFLASAVASASGWSILAEQVDDEVYVGFGHDGSTFTDKFTADYLDGEIDIITSGDWYGSEMYSWFVYNKSTELGIHSSAFLTATDSANFVLIGRIDNLTATSLLQLDNRRFSRLDGTYPAKRPTTGGGGTGVIWRDEILLVNVGSGPLTPAQEAKLVSLDTSKLDIAVSEIISHNESYQKADEYKTEDTFVKVDSLTGEVILSKVYSRDENGNESLT
jgi:hypothetical protein